MGVLQLSKAYDSKRINKACEMALNANSYSYYRIKNILENNMDKAELLDDLLSNNGQTHIPAHPNIRGASAYK
jgi:hypothetical protein